MNRTISDMVYLTSFTLGGSALAYGGLKLTTEDIANSTTGINMIGYVALAVGISMLIPATVEIYDRVKTRHNSKKSGKLEKMLD
jgi:uncharacterized membrane protein